MKLTLIGKALVVMSVALIVAGCGNSKSNPAACTDGCEEEGEESASASMSKEEILAIRCEHEMPAHQCDECRYEIGVVKLEPGVLTDGAEGGPGLVALTTVKKRAMSSTAHVTGEISLNANTTTHINPRIEGIVRSVNGDLGTKVKQGDVLFSIDSVELGTALTEYMKSASLAQLSRKNYEREKKLHEQEISSERELIEMQMTFEEHQTSLRAVEHKLHVLGLTEKEIERMAVPDHNKEAPLLPVRTPITGTVIEKHLVAGEVIEPGDDVMVVANLESVWVWADIYASDLGRLLEHKKENGTVAAQVTVQAFPERTFSGVVDYVGATMDEKTRTVKVRATLKNPDELLRPGMFCKAKIAVGVESSVPAIPESSLLSDEGEHFVFTTLGEDLYVRRPITRGRAANGFVEVLSGLTEGETIVTDGCFLLKSDILREKMGAGCAD